MEPMGSVEREVPPNPASSLPSCPFAKPMSWQPSALIHARVWSGQAGTIQTATALGEISKVKGLAID